MTHSPRLFTGTLSSHTELGKGSRIYSANRRFMLVFQHDGNLVLYIVANPGPGERVIPLWSSNTARDDSEFAAFQGDGNMVIYDDKNPWRAIWQSGTARNPGARLSVQNDGNVVIYNNQLSAVWSTGTADKGRIANEVFEEYTERILLEHSEFLPSGDVGDRKLRKVRYAVNDVNLWGEFFARVLEKRLSEALKRQELDKALQEKAKNDAAKKFAEREKAEKEKEHDKFQERLARYDNGGREPGEPPRQRDEFNDPF